ncbi:hypothetical protein RHSIM_Rhsim01G0287800 [Rhododendron simsii]|uniref:Programmed cell death protein 2 C-terminal domain-containing protein n=1 Tax=Rhododendron simsii TaxID=118357 RepID=A0A834M276_RHOSS|nr:hypothetical protein RHSIM_Rhsim01G0287800 [Rhododendron simsii]
MSDEIGGVTNGDSLEKLRALQITSLDDEALVNAAGDFSDDEDEELLPVTLGFLEKPENRCSLVRQGFPSKAGGVPAWLDPVSLPSGKSCLCDICGEPLQFLLQVYAPLSEKEPAFHRTLFVFMCLSMACLLQDQHEQWKRKPEKVSRSWPAQILFTQVNPQGMMGLTNLLELELYSVTGAVPGKEIKFVVAVEKLVIAQRNIRQCIGWQVIKLNVYRQAFLLSHLTLAPRAVQQRQKKANISYANSLVSRSQMDETVKSLLDNFEGDDDRKSWASFQEHIARAPEQVLRYCRFERAKPLWPMSSGRPSKNDIPNCSYCGGPRGFEFQILPQLLYYFGVKTDVDSLDWATIVVYTCEASCEESGRYKEEFGWVQLASPSAAVH